MADLEESDLGLSVFEGTFYHDWYRFSDPSSDLGRMYRTKLRQGKVLLMEVAPSHNLQTRVGKIQDGYATAVSALHVPKFEHMFCRLADFSVQYTHSSFAVQKGPFLRLLFRHFNKMLIFLALGSRFRAVFSHHIRRLKESGVILRLERKYLKLEKGGRPSTADCSQDVSLGYDSTMLLFAIVLAGAAVSVLLLVTELVWRRTKIYYESTWDKKVFRSPSFRSFVAR